MSIGSIAALIAAIAFVVLVVYLCLSFTKVNKILDQVQQTVTRLNTTIDVVTKDVDNLSIEVESLLNKTNTLVDDLNQKLEKTDPIFSAIGDVGVSVSELNHSTKQMTNNLVSGFGKGRSSAVRRFFTKAAVSRLKPKAKPTSQEQPRKEEEVVTSHLESLTQSKPSATAGEIKIN
ncbi:DUF948 domain-containing protein [Aerococcaceae bacterium NML191292]|nr:DUF948 domain-containing protein [Aerococcaceae bacterium NML191292]MCW6665104.1 DUF948 domain-containing protein [Aerococcaceae bacterium NML191219]MCW6675688.1 DUF948 domain-containing protein [Aerococcaceae bacterium NML171108]MCW6677441.1 DUF948 domain-containing protein [Aerococcaceae bacterium NML180378]MCW6681226.1 DUF948 domain-containing protein [Aerococcaceae bacterium NML130460]MCW6683145.1 DUF948 domain-containing protein [Aerococcaceae bacterium NML160702]